MTLTPKDPAKGPEPAEPPRKKSHPHKLGVAALTGCTAMVTTMVWPITVVPLSIFIAAATLAVEALDD